MFSLGLSPAVSIQLGTLSNNPMLERAKQRSKRKRASEGNVACRLKRHSSAINKLCIFCDHLTTESLHEFKNIRDMANEMCDSELLVKTSGGIDLVAIEGKYHLSGLTNYRYRYCAFSRAPSASCQSSIFVKQAKARAFAELVMHVESARRVYMSSN